MLIALASVAPDGEKLQRGGRASIWRFDRLPAAWQQTLDAAAGQRGCRDAAHLLSDPAAPWQPQIEGTAVKLSDLAEHCIVDAQRLQRALLPSLSRLTGKSPTPAAEAEGKGLAEYHTAFGHRVSAGHWRRLVNRTVDRAGSAGDFSRLELFLAAKLARRPAAAPGDVAAGMHLQSLRRALSRVHRPAEPTGDELLFIWSQAFDEWQWLAEDGTDARAAERIVFGVLEGSGVKIARSSDALRKSFQRKLARWQEGGCKPSALKDGRRGERTAAKLALPAEDRELLIARATERGGRDPREYLEPNPWLDDGPPANSAWIHMETKRVYSEAKRQRLVEEYNDYIAEQNRIVSTLSVEEAASKCRSAAAGLPDFLQKLCLDPNISFEQGGVSVCYFDDLHGALHTYRQKQIEAAETAIAKTTISRRVFDDLDYAAHCRGLVVIEGDQRTGKSTAAENWCARHLGQAIYVKLGVGNDDATFFRSIARALGTAASLTRKPTEMQMKIEDALQEGHLLLVVDEAHFLFAQTQRPRSAPSRLDWIRTALVDFNVGVALISTPQFDRACELYEKQLKWNAKQIKGRVKLQTLLPTELPAEDLEAVARHMAPQADEASLLRLVGFAQSSDDYLAGIERLVTRANFFANRDGREAAGRADIKRALDEATPAVERPAPVPAQKPRKATGSVRAMALQRPSNGSDDTLPAPLARRLSLDSPASVDAGFEANGRLRFTEVAASASTVRPPQSR